MTLLNLFEDMQNDAADFFAVAEETIEELKEQADMMEIRMVEK